MSNNSKFSPHIKRLVRTCFFVFILSLISTNAFAQGTSGLYNPVFGAAALAQGNAFVARADDATAIHFNPAGLTQLNKAQISLGATFVLPRVDYHGPSGRENMRREINTVPNAYFAMPVVNNRLAAGLGVTVPYGLRGHWRSGGFSKYVITEFDLKVTDVSPSLAFKPFSFLSIGAGLNYYHLKSRRKKHINVGITNSILTGLPVVPTPDADQKINEHSDAFGYNIGMLFDITPRHSVGISFSSKAVMHVNGKLRLNNLSGATAALFGSTDTMVRTRTTATLPEMVSFGYAYKRNRWSIEADLQWTNWSRFDVLEYGFRPSNVLLEADDKDVRQWHNTWSFALGGEYSVNDSIKARGGYTYHETPVPSRTFEPSVPQSSRHGVFVGGEYRWGEKEPVKIIAGEKWVDFVFGTIFYEERHINNAVGNSMGGSVDGRYDIITYMLGTNFNVSF